MSGSESESDYEPGSSMMISSSSSSSSSSSNDDLTSSEEDGEEESSAQLQDAGGESPFALWESAESREQWIASYLAQDCAWRVVHGYGIDADSAEDRLAPTAAAAHRGAQGRQGLLPCVPTRVWALLIACAAIAASFWRIDLVVLDRAAPAREAVAMAATAATLPSVQLGAGTGAPLDPSLLTCCRLFQKTVANRSTADATAASCDTAVKSSRKGSAGHLQALVRRADLHSLMQEHEAALEAYGHAAELIRLQVPRAAEAGTQADLVERKQRWARWAMCRKNHRAGRWKVLLHHATKLLGSMGVVEAEPGSTEAADTALRTTAEFWQHDATTRLNSRQGGAAALAQASEADWRLAYQARSRVLLEGVTPACANDLHA